MLRWNRRVAGPARRVAAAAGHRLLGRQRRGRLEHAHRAAARTCLVAAIGLEPSGGYERGVLRALLAAGLSVRRINPNRLRQFARARGALAKNDRIDARLIAEYVATMPTHVVRHDPAAARIAEIVTMRRQLCDEHVAIENQAAQLEDAMLRRLAKRRLARIETDIRLLDKRLTQMIAAEADLARRYARLTSMPGSARARFHPHRPAAGARSHEP